MCKIFGPKIRSCKFFDKSQVCFYYWSTIIVTFRRWLCVMVKGLLISKNHILSIMPHCIICPMLANSEHNWFPQTWLGSREEDSSWAILWEMIHTGPVLAKKCFTNDHEAFNHTLRRQEVLKLLALLDILYPKRFNLKVLFESQVPQPTCSRNIHPGTGPIIWSMVIL